MLGARFSRPLDDGDATPEPFAREDVDGGDRAGFGGDGVRGAARPAAEVACGRPLAFEYDGDFLGGGDFAGERGGGRGCPSGRSGRSG